VRYRSRQARQRSRKRVLITLLLIQIACLVLWAGLWGWSRSQAMSEAPTAENVTLSFLLNPSEKGYWDDVVSAFETDHPTIKIDLITNPGVTEDASLTDVRASIYGADFQLAEAAYDLVFMDVVWTDPFKKNLLDLNKLITQDKRQGDNEYDRSDFLQSEIEAGTIDGKFYRMPMYADVGVLYYRKDWLEAAGLDVPEAIAPTTIEALEKTIQNVSAFFKAETTLQTSSTPNIEYGYLWQGLEYEGLVANFMEVLGGQGGHWIDAKRAARLDESKAIESAKVLQQLIKREISPETVIEYTEENSKQDFIEGKAVFLRGWPDFWTAIVEAGLEDKVAVARPFSFSTNPGQGCRGGWGLGISKKAAHPNEAWEAIKYFTSEEGQRKYTAASGALPTRRVLLEERIKENTSRYVPQMIDYLEGSSVFRPKIEEYNQVSKRLQRALFNILENPTSSVTAAMDTAQTETESILKGG